MSIELMRASNPSGVTPVATTRPPGESQAPAQQSSRTRASAEPQGLDQGNRSKAKEATSIAPDEQQVTDAVEKLSKFVSNIRPEISFSVDEASGTRVVKILDRQSKEVVRQIPSEEAIQLAQALDKLQGLFVRDTA